MVLQNREAGRPIRNLWLCSGLEGMLWPLSLKGHLGYWGVRKRGADWLGRLSSYSFRIWDALLKVSLTEYPSEHSWFQGWWNPKTKRKQEILPLIWVKGRTRKRKVETVGMSRLHLNANHLLRDQAEKCRPDEHSETMRLLVTAGWCPHWEAEVCLYCSNCRLCSHFPPNFLQFTKVPRMAWLKKNIFIFRKRGRGGVGVKGGGER